MIDSAKTDAALHGGKPTVGEVISAGEMYALARGKWVKSPVSIAELKKDHQDNSDSTKATCSHLRDESVNGEPAAVWRSHIVNENGNDRFGRVDFEESRRRPEIQLSHGRRRPLGKEPQYRALRLYERPAARRRPMSGGSMADTIPLVPAPVSHRKRWIAGLIAAFILGFLLAWFLKKCPQQSPSGGAASGGAMTGGGAPGAKGSPAKLGQGSGTGGGGGGGGGGGNWTSGAGAGGSADGDADLKSGGSVDGSYGPGSDSCRDRR